MKRWMHAGLVLALILALAAPAGALNIERSYTRFACVTGEAVTTGAAVVMKSDGLCYKADADDSALRPAIGVAASAASLGGTVGVVTGGVVGGETALTKGGAMYLSVTAGGTTQTQPAAYSQSVGRAISATQWTIGVQPPQPVKVLVTTVEDLAANVDIGDGTAANARKILIAPSALTISAVKLYGRAAPAGIDDSNTAVIKIYNSTSVVLVKTFNSPTAWPASFTETDLGTVSNANVTSGNSIRFDLVNGTNANPPAFDLYLEYFTGD